MRIKTLFLIALCFISAACAGNQRRQVLARYNADDITAKEKGLAVYSLEQNIFLGGITEATLSWLGPDGQEVLFGYNANFDSEILGNGASLHRYTSFLPPGKYVLNKFTILNSVSFANKITNRTVDFTGDYEASFTITPGEITYLGNIIIEKLSYRENKGFLQPEGGTLSSRVLVTEEAAKIMDYLNKFKKDTAWPARLYLIELWRHPPKH